MKRIMNLLLATMLICSLTVPTYAQSLAQPASTTLSEGNIIIIAVIAVIAVLAVIWFVVKNKKNKK